MAEIAAHRGGTFTWSATVMRWALRTRATCVAVGSARSFGTGWFTLIEWPNTLRNVAAVERFHTMRCAVSGLTPCGVPRPRGFRTMRCAATGLTTDVFCWQRPGWMLRVTSCVRFSLTSLRRVVDEWFHTCGVPHFASGRRVVCIKRCAIFCLAAVSRQAVCRDGVADRHVLWSGFTPAVCR